jgi:Ca-activated chloride channel homolog
MLKSKLFIVLLSAISVLTIAFMPKMNADKTPKPTVVGTVTDSTGAGLIGASIVVKGTNTGTMSDLDGKYALTLAAGKYTLVYSFTGFTNVEKPITVVEGKPQTLNVVLAESAARLEEVVVTGYATQMAKRDMRTTTVGKPNASYAISSYSTAAYATKSKAKLSPKTDKKHAAIAKHQRDSIEQIDGHNTEEYGYWVENSYKSPKDEALSTFSIDVDRASYANIRRFINSNQKPPSGAVRIEEMVNYFDYNYPQPQANSGHPLSIITEIGACPWQKDHILLHVGLQGKKIDLEKAPKNNLVFLIDVSGSMGSPNKLPLVKDALKILVNNLRQEDRVSLVVYAGAAGCVLPSTSGANKAKILDALDALDAGGSTAGGAGIQLAYKIAKDNFIKNGNNRIILASDGDFNVGVSSESELAKLIEEKRKEGVSFSVLGFGMGNYKDNKMEQLADKGNGNYAYIDNIDEAKKVFGKEMGGTLYTIAKDVKLQLEFNPAVVASYRLIGYENRLLNKEDFNDDTKDAGDIGAGHTVTALYEIVPKGAKTTALETPSVNDLRYQQTTVKGDTKDMVFIKLRYKKPDTDNSILMEQNVVNQAFNLIQPSDNFKFSAAVAGFAQILRGSKYIGNFDFQKAKILANSSLGADTEGYRAAFVKLIEKAEGLTATAKK